jgi:glyoxylase I family protein
MPVALTKQSVDLGIVTMNGDSALAFYRDTLGFKHQGDMPMPGGGKMHRLLCGESLIKIVVPGKTPPAKAAPGGIQGSTGYRYWTMTVSNLSEILAACKEKGYKVAIPETEIRPGVRIGMVEDPDGNWVEFLST